MLELKSWQRQYTPKKCLISWRCVPTASLWSISSGPLECSGPGKWSEYCEEFRLAWEENSLEIDDVSDEDVRLQGSITEET